MKRRYICNRISLIVCSGLARCLPVLVVFGMLLSANTHSLPNASEIKAKRDALSSQEQTDEVARLADSYSSILEYSELSTQLAEQIADLQQNIEEAPALLDRLKLQTKQLERNPPTLNIQRYQPALGEDTVTSATLVNRIEERLAQEKSSYARVASGLKLLKEELKDARNNRAGLQTESIQVNQRINKIEKSLANYTEIPEAPLQEKVSQWLLQAELASLRKRRQLLQLEWTYSQPKINITQAKIQSTELQMKYAGELVSTLEELLSEARIKVANLTTIETQQELVESQNKHPLVIQLATENATLSRTVGSLSLQLRESQQQSAELSQQLAQLKERFQVTRQKLEIAGLSQAIGQLLLKEQRLLPLAARSQVEARELQNQLANIGLSQLEHQRERRELSDLQAYAEDYSSEAESALRADTKALLVELAESRRDLLDKAIETEQALLQALTELEWTAIELERTIAEFTELLTERLLWVRSSPSVSKALLHESYQSLTSGQILKTIGWREISFQHLHLSIWNGLSLLLAVTIVVKRRKLRALLAEQLLPLKRLATDSIRFTFQATFLAIVLAVPVPLFLATLGSGLQMSGGQSPLVVVFGSTLITIAGYAFVLQAMRIMFLPKGVVTGHLKWPNNIAVAIRKDLARLLYLFLPVALVTGMLIQIELDSSLGVFAHTGLLVMLVLLSYCFYQFFNNPGGLLAIYRNKAERPPPELIQNGLKFIFITAPLIFALLGLMGYILTAATLTVHLLDTFLFLVIAYLLQKLVLRWLTLSQRQLAYKAALEKRAARQKQAETEPEPAAAELEVEEYTVDIDQLSKGAQQLFNTLLAVFTAFGVWWIWSEVLPAFTPLQDVSVWTYSETSNNQEQIIPVTLFDLGLALLILVVTILAAKRIPALLEFVLLQRIKMSAGGHYTMRTLTGYIIVAVGFMIILSTIGVSWSQLQWLAAALSVGIGFGLQEIVANFISGLIILFERPIRVGDVVTVGDTDGVVTRIQIRATTIRNWDQKELLVPNKEFITGRLLNWTLSDQTVRVLIPVGIAYGSDVEQAMKIITKILEAHPLVLKDPNFMVTFESFGDNALILYIRAYVARLDQRLPLTTDLHTEIYQAMNEAGIGIAFPQRDVHLDTSRPLEVQISRLRSAQDNSEEGP